MATAAEIMVTTIETILVVKMVFVKFSIIAEGKNYHVIAIRPRRPPQADRNDKGILWGDTPKPSVLPSGRTPLHSLVVMSF